MNKIVVRTSWPLAFTPLPKQQQVVLHCLCESGENWIHLGSGLKQSGGGEYIVQRPSKLVVEVELELSD